MESGKEIARRATSNGDELVVTIWNGKESYDAKSSTTTQVKKLILKLPTELERLKSRAELTPTTAVFSPGITSSRNSSQPQEAATESAARRQSSASPKPVETSVSEEKTQQALTSSPPKSEPMTPRNPSTTAEEEEEDEKKKEELVYQAFNLAQAEKQRKRLKFLLIKFIAMFVCIIGWLIATLTTHKLKHTMIWNLEIWKWSVLVSAILCGRSVAELSITSPAFLTEHGVLFGHKVLFFLNGLKKSMVVLIWLGLILVAWGVLIEDGMKKPSKNKKMVLNHVTRALASCLVGAALWMAKDMLVLILGYCSHVSRFYDRIRKSVFDQHLLMKLSVSDHGSSRNKESFVCEKVEMMEAVRGSRLYTECGPKIYDEKIMVNTADRIFEEVAKTDSEYIHEKDLLRYMEKEDVDNAIPLFQGATDSGKIKKSSFKKWAVDAYKDRKSLENSFKSTKTAIDELDKILTGITVIAVILVWLLLIGLVTTKVIIFISSQLLLVTFMFGNTCKTIFESIIFVFVLHPFDLDDRCSIDGVQMVVEEMKLLTTIFLRYDGEKIIYPNSVLTTKPIGNFYRSPPMGDSVEFAIDFSTSTQTLDALKERIKRYLESKPHRWNKDHSVLVKDIVNINQMNIGVYVTHTINFQNPGRTNLRRSDLLLELKKIFEELHIKYHLLPQEVHLKSIDSALPAFSITRR